MTEALLRHPAQESRRKKRRSRVAALGVAGVVGVAGALVGLLGSPTLSGAGGVAPSLNYVEAGKRLDCGERAIAGTILENDGVTPSAFPPEEAAVRSAKAFGITDALAEVSFRSADLAEYFFRTSDGDLVGLVLVERAANGWVPAMITACGQEVGK